MDQDILASLHRRAIPSSNIYTGNSNQQVPSAGGGHGSRFFFTVERSRVYELHYPFRHPSAHCIPYHTELNLAANPLV